ncbi:hypothetical protein [Amycolatopsis dendrobii]|uniref:Uncharacterized protein n=1 Tax=Amycolatopsis dendrobii TaxID=2760662 RepID=A0A7W3VSQ8_9PSEU|nr:hypothetical protein [Amycolatopsis dendrobii]MBB1152514.1 hypothetical protein [Amycolatopsis dendrobii]
MLQQAGLAERVGNTACRDRSLWCTATPTRAMQLAELAVGAKFLDPWLRQAEDFLAQILAAPLNWVRMTRTASLFEEAHDTRLKLHQEEKKGPVAEPYA